MKKKSIFSFPWKLHWKMNFFSREENMKMSNIKDKHNTVSSVAQLRQNIDAIWYICGPPLYIYIYIYIYIYVGLGWFVFPCATQRRTLQGTPSSSCWNSPKSCSSASSSLPSAQDSVSWTPPCPCSQCTRYRRDTTRSMLRLLYCTTTIVAQCGPTITPGVFCTLEQEVLNSN